MATAGEMVRLTAEAFELPQATVASFHRMLREAGMVTVGGRGPSAPQMKASDVANLALALLGADALAEVAAITTLLGQAQSAPPPDSQANERWDDGPVSLGEGIAVLLRQIQAPAEIVSGRLPGIGWIAEGEVILSVTATSLRAKICYGGFTLEFASADRAQIAYPADWTALGARERLLARAQVGGMEVTRSIDRIVLGKLVRALPAFDGSEWF